LVIWLLLSIAFIFAAVGSVILSFPAVISCIILLTSLVPGYFLYRSAKLGIYNKARARKARQRIGTGRGKIIAFPEGGKKNTSFKR